MNNTNKVYVPTLHINKTNTSVLLDNAFENRKDAEKHLLTRVLNKLINQDNSRLVSIKTVDETGKAKTYTITDLDFIEDDEENTDEEKGVENFLVNIGDLFKRALGGDIHNE